MAVKTLSLSATGCTGVLSIKLTESYSQPTVTAEIRCTGHSLSLGDTVTAIVMGIVGDSATVLAGGIVKDIRASIPDFAYTITVHDILIRAVDYFIASDNPDAPFQANNISAEDLVGALLALAGITDYDGGYATGFTFGVPKPVNINLTTVWDYLENIARITSSVIYADNAGQVHFAQRKPYLVGGDVAEHTYTEGNSGDILRGEYHRSDEKLRNKVVCYGAEGIFATAQATSPYVPSGFFKGMVVAHELITSTQDAQRTCDLNLELFNRLTETVDLEVLFSPTIRVRDVVGVTSSHLGLSNDLFVVYGLEGTIDENGFSGRLALVR